MSLHLIIDGYNLIRHSPELLALEAQDLRWGREALLEKLAAYRRLKKYAITVVFDGWESGECQGNRDRFQGMLIIYSRRGEKADEVIKRLADRERERGLIISSDRQIVDHAEHAGAAAMSAAEFIDRLHYAGINDTAAEVEEEEVMWSGTKKKGHRTGTRKTPAPTPTGKKNITSNQVFQEKFNLTHCDYLEARYASSRSSAKVMLSRELA